MPTTNIRGRQILDGDVARVDLNTGTSSSAVIRKLLPTSDASITLTSTGADAGTGDVTLVASKATSTQLGVVRIGSGLSVDINGIVSVAGTSGITGTGSVNSITKFTGSSTIGNSLLNDDGNGVTLGTIPTFNYKFNIQGISGYYISFWTPTILGVNNNGLISHGGGGYLDQKPMGYNATIHVFNGEVTGGGVMQVAGDVNITGAFKVNGSPITGGGGATSLAGLTDVSITSPANGNILIYDSATGKWKNQANTATGVTGSGTTNYITKWSSSSSLATSYLYDNSGEIILDSTTPLFTCKQSGSIKTQLGYVANWGTSAVISNGTNLLFSIGGQQDMILDTAGRLLIGNNGSPNLMFEFTGGGISNRNTGLTTDLRATGRITQDLTNVRGVGFGYSASSQLGFIYATTVAGVASKLGIVVYDGQSTVASWKTVTSFSNNGSNTVINILSIPSSTTGLTTGDLYKDSNGFVKIMP